MQSLNIKYRPHKLEDVVEQGVTTKILSRVIETRTFKNAYLLCGASGCGKTTIARIFANAINNVTDPAKEGYIEKDAASNNGVDEVRAIIDSAKQRDLVYEYKIFIIDEAHAITSAGWQAFLKSIEEPSKYTIFIFCTTEPNKIPATILNRVQRYNISKISQTGIKNRLMEICAKEGFSNYEATCDFISKISRGGMRDAVTYLDQCVDYSSDLSLENAKKVLGDYSYETMLRLTNALIEKDQTKVFSIIDALYNSGVELKGFIGNYLSFMLDVSTYILTRDISLTNIPAYLESSQNLDINLSYTVGEGTAGLNYFNKLAELLLTIKDAIRVDPDYKSTIKAYLLKACMPRGE